MLGLVLLIWSLGQLDGGEKTSDADPCHRHRQQKATQILSKSKLKLI